MLPFPEGSAFCNVLNLTKLGHPLHFSSVCDLTEANRLLTNKTSQSVINNAGFSSSQSLCLR